MVAVRHGQCYRQVQLAHARDGESQRAHERVGRDEPIADVNEPLQAHRPALGIDPRRARQAVAVAVAHPLEVQALVRAAVIGTVVLDVAHDLGAGGRAPQPRLLRGEHARLVEIDAATPGGERGIGGRRRGCPTDRDEERDDQPEDRPEASIRSGHGSILPHIAGSRHRAPGASWHRCQRASQTATGGRTACTGPLKTQTCLPRPHRGRVQSRADLDPDLQSRKHGAAASRDRTRLRGTFSSRMSRSKPVRTGSVRAGRENVPKGAPAGPST